MGDSRTRAEDKLAEAEENQRQLLGATVAPSLARVQRDMGGPAACATEQTTFYAPHGHKPELPDDGPQIDIRCGPAQVYEGMVYLQNQHGHSLELTMDRAKEVWEALTVLIREEIIK